MVTIARVVERYIEEHPFIHDALSRGIINNAALANELLPRLKRELRVTPTFSAVNMALRRYGEKAKTRFAEKVLFDERCAITLQTDLIEIVLYKEEHVQGYIRELHAKVKIREGGILTITQGFHEIMVITNRRYEKEVLALIPSKYIKKFVKNLSSVTITLPEEGIHGIGLFYTATRSLNWENINIIDIVSTLTEMTFIIKKEDSTKALESLQDLIESQRAFLLSRNTGKNAKENI
ncbi:hypothetical protein HYZ97_03265 [Candidatus Pacearchaeota archaeon]|nr:hypothetical protein [Candidatus Pacearchaeota archaeon]